MRIARHKHFHTSKKHKKFPINIKLKAMIDKFIDGKADEDPFFKTRFNDRLDRFQIAYKIINSACREAGLDCKIGTHSLRIRKTFGYHHHQQFKDVVILQKIFNHSSPSTTLRYIGIEQEEIDESYNNFIL